MKPPSDPPDEPPNDVGLHAAHSASQAPAEQITDDDPAHQRAGITAALAAGVGTLSRLHVGVGQ